MCAVENRLLKIRGHTLLCLQGFRGKGYSPAFVENMASIHRELRAHPDRLVQVVVEPDSICAACPHHLVSGCSLNGDRSEDAMIAQDQHVLSLLGLEAGVVAQWSEILGRIQASISGGDLPAICGNCRWLPLGYCRSGLDQLRESGLLMASLIQVSPQPKPIV